MVTDETTQDETTEGSEEKSTKNNVKTTVGDDLNQQQNQDYLEDHDPPQNTTQALDAIYDVPIKISVVLGSAELKIGQLLKMGRGAIIELDRKVGEAIDIYVNNRLIARGEVVVVENQLGITMTEIIKTNITSI